MGILVVGDSHTSVFSQKNLIPPEYPPNIYMNFPFKIYRCGAPLAYSLIDTNTYYKAREKLEYILKREVIKGDSIILSFGEIDLRYHIFRQSIIQQKDPNEIVSICIERYLKAIKEIFKNYFCYINKIGIWGPIASTWLGPECSNRDCPITDNMVNRNIITDKFNIILKDGIDKINKDFYRTNIFYLSIFKHLIDGRYFTKREYYMDNIHLSQNSWILIENELRDKGFIL